MYYFISFILYFINYIIYSIYKQNFLNFAGDINGPKNLIIKQ